MIKTRYILKKLSTVIVLFCLIGCNRNSLELPPSKSNIVSKESTCMVGNTAIALIRFSQDTVVNPNGTINIEITNLTGAAINDCQIFIEMCEGTPSLNSCQNQFVYTVTQLSEKEPGKVTLPFKNVQLSTVNVNVGIVSTSKRATYLSNIYDESYVKFVNKVDSLSENGSVKGVVFADGKSTFRLGLADTSYYNITGTFIDTSYFNNGVIFSQASVSSPFLPGANVKLSDKKDKHIFFKNTDNDTVRFGLALDKRLQVPTFLSFADSIIFTLIKH